jgi:hypothetical protein
MSEIGNLEMEDLLFKQLHNVSGYVTRDDIITIRSHKNNLSHLFGISMGLEVSDGGCFLFHSI